MQALNPVARQQARSRVGRVTPDILSRLDRNFLKDRVPAAHCVGEITMNEPRKRFIGKPNDVNTKARHTGDSMLVEIVAISLIDPALPAPGSKRLPALA